MKTAAARDRWIMSGLVLLGLVTVMAGVFSGRSTIDYVLSRDARDAALGWTQELSAQLARSNGAGLPAREDVQILDAAALANAIGADSRAMSLPAGGSPSQGTLGIVEGLNQLTHGWILRKLYGGQSEYVSRRDGFAVLAPDGRPLAVAGELSADQISEMVSEGRAKAAMGDTVMNGSVQLAEIPNADKALRLALVPVSRDGKISHVFAYSIDQTAAASLTNAALTVATLTTSLLIVMGFSVPALIASRRIRERWHAEDRIHFLALHDSLTGLPNRVQLDQHLEHAVARARRRGEKLAVFCLDLDRFKDVNDTLGHSTGDALLEEVSARLRETIRNSDLVGRLGGDEFAIVAEEISSPEDAVQVARRICDALAATYCVGGHEVTTSASIGIALGPTDGEQPDALLKHADLALYRAKEDGRNTFRFFEPEMDAALQRRRRLETDLRNALQRGQLYLDYQPQFGLEDGSLSGYEALVRWWHPSEGDIPPSTFVPIAEETGLIGPLGEWILETACSYAATWPHDTKLAVNLSPAQFKTQDVCALVSRVLAQTGLEPHRLELEITERTILQNTDAVIETLIELDKLGVSIAMDDFGTGYSSLSYLTRFPVKKIKIDRSFIDTLGSSDDTSAIVSSIVGLGQSLHVTITAEGVESESQAAMLRQWGCDQVQGYYYGRPEAEIASDDLGEVPLDMAAPRRPTVDPASDEPVETGPLRRLEQPLVG